MQRQDTIQMANKQISYEQKLSMNIRDPGEKSTMEVLGQMGYTDFDKNIMLCRRYRNDIN